MPKAQANPAGIAALRSAFAAWQRGDLVSAEADCRRAMGLGVDDARSWTLLGSILSARDPQAAETALQRALLLDADFPDAHFQLGNLHRSLHRTDAAIESYRRTLALAPDNPSVMNNLALALDENGARESAIEIWRRALRIDSGHRQSQENLIHALTRAGFYRDASEVCSEHLRRFPDANAEIWANQGICRYHLGDYAESVRCLRRAVALDPDNIAAKINLATTLVDANEYVGAEQILGRALAQSPRHPYLLTMLAYCRQQLCRWEGLAALHRAILECGADDGGGKSVANPFVALSIPMPAAMHLQIARRWAKTWLPTPVASVGRPPPVTPASRAKLRVGYVSSDFRSHPIAYLLTEVWERHDRNRFETFAYSIGPSEASPLRARIEAAFDHFHDCRLESADGIAQRIRNDGIDLLIDLNGYTTMCRSEIFAMRPARIQISWLGYLGSMGADFIDYIITDRITTPPDEQTNFAERFLYLPNCYCPSDTHRPVAMQPPSRAECGLPADGFVFCCFNNSYKILPDVFDVWTRLLDVVEGSVLWLAPGNSTAAENLRYEAARRGIDPARLVFAPRVPLPEHLARHVHADLLLDTTPYNAGTMTNDALFMGVPVVTVLGSAMAGRVAASQLNAIGLPELVASDPSTYESLAVRLANEPGASSAMRSRIQANRLTHPLFDMARFTRDLEDALARVAGG